MRQLGPVFFGNINFRGTMSFSIDRYAEVLLRPSKPARNSAAAELTNSVRHFFPRRGRRYIR